MRFLREVAKGSSTEDCIEWPFCRRASGYGLVRFKGKNTTAHRVALVLATGLEPAEMDAAHGPCHNRGCVNPSHLEWKTRSENHLDKVRDGTDLRGSQHPNSKLTEAQVLKIRADGRAQRVIALDYGVGQVTVSRVKNGHRYGHLHGIKR